MTFRWLPAILWGVVIFVLSLMPGGNADMIMFGIPHFDKIGHFGMYAIWALLMYYAFSGEADIVARTAFLLSVLFCGLTGIALEFGQFYLASDRSFELADMIANGLGAVTGAVLGWKGRRLLGSGIK